VKRKVCIILCLIGFLLQSQAGKRLAGIEDAHPRAVHGIGVFSCQGGGARERDGERDVPTGEVGEDVGEGAARDRRDEHQARSDARLELE